MRSTLHTAQPGRSASQQHQHSPHTATCCSVTHHNCVVNSCVYPGLRQASVLAAIPYTSADSSPSLYTHKQYLLKTALPAWAQRFIGTNALAVRQHNHTHAAHYDKLHPYSHTSGLRCCCADSWRVERGTRVSRSTTVYHIPLLGNKVHWTIQSIAVPNDRGDIPNPFNLSPSQLASRQLVHTSLTDDSLLSHSHSQTVHSSPLPPSEDPKLFHSASSSHPAHSIVCDRRALRRSCVCTRCSMCVLGCGACRRWLRSTSGAS